ncbi:MAG: hypothetical protein JXQ82_05965 [Methanomicrobiaceae archaeon]|nr:hypothetical protein [Methanomicrobiaceae archaeon]
MIYPASADIDLTAADYSSGLFENKQDAGIFLYSNSTVYFFYSSHCSACQKTLPYIKEAETRYPDVKIYYYNVDLSNKNLTLFFDFAEYFKNPYPAYPIVYTGDSTILEGFNAISANIEDIFKGLDEDLIPDPDYENKPAVKPLEYRLPTAHNEEKKADLSLYLVLSAGLFDGINPCAFAVLVFLLMALTAAGSKKQIIILGFSYILAVFLFYITAGIGIMSVVSFTGFSLLFSLIAGAVAIAAGLINIAEGVYEKSPVSLRIPLSSKEFIQSFIKKASVPGVFILGILVGIFELPCTGGIYLAVLSLIASEMTVYEGILYLIIYNLMFVLPLAIIVSMVYLGLSPASLNEFRENQKRKFRIILGAVLLLIGFFILFLNLI